MLMNVASDSAGRIILIVIANFEQSFNTISWIYVQKNKLKLILLLN